MRLILDIIGTIWWVCTGSKPTRPYPKTAQEQLEYPDLRRQAFDVSVDAWFKRIARWGKLKIRLTRPGEAARMLSPDNFKKFLADYPEDVVGKFESRVVDVFVWEMRREVTTYLGDRGRETVRFSVDFAG